jgi:hypothetical protein
MMTDNVIFCINSGGSLEYFEIDPSDLFCIRVVISREMERDARFSYIVDSMIRQREREGWRVILGCDKIGRFTSTHPGHDYISIKQYYKRYGAELTPVPEPPTFIRPAGEPDGEFHGEGLA